MGKGTRKRDVKKSQMKMLRRERERKLENRKRAIKHSLTTLGVAVCIAAVVFAWIGIDGMIKDSGSTLRDKVGVTTQNYSVDNAMMSYFLNATFHSYADYYGTSIASILETDKPLKSQIYSGTETWFDYFLDAATTNVSSLLVLAEGAKADGVSLTDAENAAIDTYVSNMNSERFGRGVNRDDVKRCIQLMALAYKYESQLQKSMEPTDDEITAYYKEHTTDYDTVDYLKYVFTYTDETEDALYASAQELAAKTTQDDFLAWIGKYAPEHDGTAMVTAQTNAKVTSSAYKADDKIAVWAFKDGTALESTTIIEDTTKKTFTVCMLTKAPAPDKTISKNVMHILVSDTTFLTDDAAELKAAEILSDWEVNDGTAEGFAMLALAYSEDSGSSMKGGAYYNIAPGDMVEEFDAWCFDATRKPGDTGIVETDFGYHIMYFIGDGLEVTKGEISSLLVTNEYNAEVKELTTKYPVTVDEKILAKIYE